MEIKKRILNKLGEMNKYLDELEEMLPLENEYNRNIPLKRGCEKTMQLAIECIIDIMSMIVTYAKLGFPEDEDDIINKLKVKKILTEKTAVKITGMKGFRNILVHRYGELKDDKAYENMSEQLDDFQQFEQEIRTYLKTLKK